MDGGGVVLGRAELWKLSTASHFTTYTSTNFSTFLDTLPYSTTLSYAAEVQVVLAAVPLVALGFIGLTVAVFQLSLAHLNRAFVDLFVGASFAFLGGLFQLFNVLNCEGSGDSTLNPSLGAIEGIALAVFVAFKFGFLFRRTQHPARHETPVMRTLPFTQWEAEAKGEEEEKEKSMSFMEALRATDTRVGERGRGSSDRLSQSRGSLWLRGAGTPVWIHSASYARWGITGDVIKVFLYLAIFLVAFLEGFWRVGFARGRVRSLTAIYALSNVVQIALLLFFAAKIIYSTLLLDLRPRRSKFLDVAPLLSGIGIGVAVAIASLAVFVFSETPLGRLFVLIELFIFLLEMMVQDHNKPHRDSWSFEPSSLPRLTNPALLSGDHSSRARARQVRVADSAVALSDASTPTLPERITVRKGSTVPSWLGHQRFRSLPEQLSTPTAGSSTAVDGAELGVLPLHGEQYLPSATKTTATTTALNTTKSALLVQALSLASPGHATLYLDPTDSNSTYLFPESVRESEASLDPPRLSAIQHQQQQQNQQEPAERGRIIFPRRTLDAVEENSPPFSIPSITASATLDEPTPLAFLAALRGARPSGRSPLARQATAAASPSVYSKATNSPPKTAQPIDHAIASLASVQPLRTVGIAQRSAAAAGPAARAGGEDESVLVIAKPARPAPTPQQHPTLAAISSTSLAHTLGASSRSSALSLSRFPEPPQPDSFPQTESSHTSDLHARMVSEGGVEFDLFPPAQAGTLARTAPAGTWPDSAREESHPSSAESDTLMGEEAKVTMKALNVTSFMLGEGEGEVAARTLQRQIAAARHAPSSSVDSNATAKMPVSTSFSEFAIKQARSTYVPGSAGALARERSLSAGATATRQDSRDLLVEAQGRVIPPRFDSLTRSPLESPAAPPPVGPLPSRPVFSRPVLVEQTPPSSTAEELDSATPSTGLFDPDTGRSERSASTPLSTTDSAPLPFKMFEHPRPAPPLRMARDEPRALLPKAGPVESRVSAFEARAGTAATRVRM